MPARFAAAEQVITDRGIDPATARGLLEAWTERNGGDIVGLSITYHPIRTS